MPKRWRTVKPPPEGEGPWYPAQDAPTHPFYRFAVWLDYQGKTVYNVTADGCLNRLMPKRIEKQHVGIDRPWSYWKPQHPQQWFGHNWYPPGHWRAWNCQHDKWVDRVGFHECLRCGTTNFPLTTPTT